jgi:hypothetical protein
MYAILVNGQEYSTRFTSQKAALDKCLELEGEIEIFWTHPNERFELAKAALQGLLSGGIAGKSPMAAAILAVQLADETIAALNP